MPEKEAFGPHLILSGFGCPVNRLKDLALVHNFLDRMPDFLGMTKIMPPYLFQYTDGEWGISGMVLIAESHISVHTFPGQRSLLLDVFSCKEFDRAKTIQETLRCFGVARYTFKVLDRGTEFAGTIESMTGHLKTERQAFCRGGGG
jgi:S-adenosylmethionine decarboxylase